MTPFRAARTPQGARAVLSYELLFQRRVTFGDVFFLDLRRRDFGFQWDFLAFQHFDRDLTGRLADQERIPQPGRVLLAGLDVVVALDVAVDPDRDEIFAGDHARAT